MERLDCDRMLVAVLEMGNFAAAARLGTSSGKASKMISLLEACLGVQRIKRTTRALSLTGVGQTYYHRIKILLDELNALDALGAQQRCGCAVCGRPLPFPSAPDSWRQYWWISPANIP